MTASPTLHEWDEIYECVTIYGIHILLGFFLCAVTIYRREMSCNRVFHEDNDAEEESFDTDSQISDELEEETEELLEGAGMYCSGQPIIHLASLWLDAFPCDDPEPSNPSKLLQHEISTSDLLERAGNYCSGEPIVAAMALLLFQNANKQKALLEAPRRKNGTDYLTISLPPDAHVQIASFLHPKDVLSLSCVSKSYRKVIEQTETAQAIWTTLWRRDYAWLVHEWQVGKEALKRSIGDDSYKVDKDLYFNFGYAYINYILAGQNTPKRCLVGLHSHIYDITSFMDRHPGSPDTLMVYAGRDASQLFEAVGHSSIARRIAKNLCLVADMAQISSCDFGLRPTEHIATQVETTEKLPQVFSDGGEGLMLGRKQRLRGGTLDRIRTKHRRELIEFENKIDDFFDCTNEDILSERNSYYDPFRKRWMFWYTNKSWQAVHVTMI